jgi:hypothetical protein
MKQYNKLMPIEVDELVAYAEGNADLSTDLYYKVFEHFVDEMPYGTAKARDGDPFEWIGDRLGEMGAEEIRATFQI